MSFIFTLIVLGLGTLMADGVEPTGNPRQVSTVDHLLWISTNSSFWGDDFEQLNDIDASATATWNDDGWGGYFGFSPIGNDATKFTGSYNGNGYAIDGLTISRRNITPQDDIGLFGIIGTGGDPAIVQNLGITNADIQGSINVGCLIGVTRSGSTVSNCYSTGIISNSYLNVGGLIGTNYSSTVTNCYSTASVDGSSRVGGLVGYNYFGSIIQRSCSMGDVVADGWGGGLVGESGGTVTNRIRDCYSTGDVTRTVGSGTDTFGGFCGDNNYIINRCYSTGSVTYAGATDPTNAGFVGNDLAGTYNDNFWDSDLSNQTSAIGAEAKTSTEMKDVATFTATATVGLDNPWDFVTDPNDDVGTNDWWDMDLTPVVQKVRTLCKTMDIDDGYPFLGWQNGTDTALPVELSSFTVENILEGVICKWTTESEVENLGFVLERKTDGTDWNEIAGYKNNNTLMGQGTISYPTDYEYLDSFVEPNTTYEYRLADVDYNGVITYHSVRTVTVDKAPLPSAVEGFTVLPAYPNPFNPITTITYGLDTDSKVTINIYDITGQLITTLLNIEQAQGWHSIQWNGTNHNNEQVHAGIYLSRITSNNNVKTTKLMLLK